MSERGYALHCGLSRPAVSKARLTGKLVFFSDGSIDAEASDRRRAETTDPAMRRARQPLRPVPADAVDAVVETLAEAGDGMTFLQARTANEVLKAELLNLELRQKRGELIDRRKAGAMVFSLARQERDSWLNWPARVAAGMAAELGADPHRLQTVLENHVRQHLAGLAEIKPDLR
ncbi:MAG: elements of external origin [Rhodospirillales bacterium]